MKKLLLGLAALGVSITGPMQALADEGMWLLPFIEKMNIEQMKAKGLRLDAKDIYDLNNTSLKDAIVIFGGGCTGEIISPNGLIATNHHCGYGSIQQHSTVEHDYLKNGFWAQTLEEELPTPGLAVTFIREIRDVTPEVLAKVKPGMTEAQRSETIRKASDRIVKANSDPKTFRYAQVTPMFGGNQYLLFVTERFTDVRMVGAPPSSIGKFGGDTDNWMWPRHTGDFSLFRVYASPDNKPAAYSKDNVPYRAPKHLEISLRGYNEGDYAMIMGFPGRTNRYMTSYEIDQVLQQDNPIRIFVRGERQKLLWEDMMADPKVRIQYASKYAGSSNYWKNSIGMSRGLRKLDVRSKKEAQQAEFAAWVAADPERQQKYGRALPLIDSAVQQRRAAARIQQFMNEALRTGVESFGLGMTVNGILSNAKDDAKAVKALRHIGKAFFEDYSPSTDRKVTLRMLQIFADSVSAADEPTFFAAVRPDVAAYAANLSDHSLLTDTARFYAALENFDRAQWTADPAVAAAASIAEKNETLVKEALRPAANRFAEGHRLWVAGLLEMNPDKAYAPDANFTLRLTYGQVLPYWAADAVFYNYFTTLGGVMAKEDPANPDFIVPERLKELYRAKDFGPYAVNGEVPTCFLTNNDITGGNSGSPVLDADGRLLGLAFDGNWEAMSGDIAFEPDVQRTIAVDIRYVLFIIDKYAGCRRLIDEMTIVR
ncbi:S46 family peptidase [uncultured Rikenella sp.]|uniref:S46 family peptidase n=1 Tax=uncultured Rikenella sp. TaxID=368003 RepID=UPI00262DF077|nr:S46 family peptidase [uncultured Rikenella sp.]